METNDPALPEAAPKRRRPRTWRVLTLAATALVLSGAAAWAMAGTSHGRSTPPTPPAAPAAAPSSPEAAAPVDSPTPSPTLSPSPAPSPAPDTPTPTPPPAAKGAQNTTHPAARATGTPRTRISPGNNCNCDNHPAPSTCTYGGPGVAVCSPVLSLSPQPRPDTTGYPSSPTPGH
ncbi:hypothetical protein ACGFX4_18430 [Kitasatospora sp. NPDC048365]|uniref:hypothetical protein n=1 Tax=Kitasatospora sp. NPDC048365 TaxID=3364050 RepID=UPI0037199531